MRVVSWRCGRVGLLAGVGLALGCVTIGRDFPVRPVQQLEIGTTTRADVKRLFGDPWRVGVEDGQRSWTYGLYHFNLLLGGVEARDLVIRFDRAGVVRSYSFNSSDPTDSRPDGP